MPDHYIVRDKLSRDLYITDESDLPNVDIPAERAEAFGPYEDRESLTHAAARILGYEPARYVLRREKGILILRRLSTIYETPDDTEVIGGFRTTTSALDALDAIS